MGFITWTAYILGAIVLLAVVVAIGILVFFAVTFGGAILLCGFVVLIVAICIKDWNDDRKARKLKKSKG